MLTLRMHYILDNLVDNNQGAFVPEKITDNIILSHGLVKGYEKEEYIIRVYDKNKYAEGLCLGGLTIFSPSFNQSHFS